MNIVCDFGKNLIALFDSETELVVTMIDSRPPNLREKAYHFTVDAKSRFRDIFMEYFAIGFKIIAFNSVN